ncbi:Asp-tRNA(Asn)/Glu-tRNA(Gln) amidotransferase subunit GatB [Fluviicola sp.]|jgi:aspartyl-tRNA(Asn)/glutamyl-tRNA(Gln) amidotransferase subunit B|uniref:Asp-tRNA(Asn)/Glu-tRNA(Gln) amidotransferase subunit GatB n=1 Tax=Fluviicola sp. TaxID=1917219 RepID=UPI002832D79B|nr:Asp-tRNA(Asn)/Glu-tRNA(Gln) amidotransferase subunit GatB [Fluviicola sp.]MDR0802724.1 Asp-tRNA(Asn)/Glu-tRNA(Gln) amidotransferase subunit GatB [Fluviicola sp.]
MNIKDKYEAVIGLEVHAQLLTKTKAYSSDINEYGAHPNTNVSVVTLGHPGTLPVMNKKTIEFAVKLGLACGCMITEHQHFARKNYFYPDLPKGYQITQDTTPICTGGSITIKNEDGAERPIGLTRIHMEEDAGKSIHDVDLYDTLVDLNRAGTPLLEIVSEPEIRSSQEAYNYLTEVRRLVRYLDICDGNMEEGSLRCDANISVRLKGASGFGTKVEVKNMNSIRNVQRAIEFEIERQIIAVENGENISSETRSFDALKGITISMRSKEAANDYRYFPEPDLQPIVVNATYVNQVKAKMPALPRELYTKYTQNLKLSDYDAGILTDSKSIALFFEEVITHTKNYKAAANWTMGEVKSYLNQNGLEVEEFPISAKQVATIINLIESGKISNSAAAQKLFPALIEKPNSNPEELAVSLNIIQESNADSLKEVILSVFGQHPDEVSRFKAGENQLTGFFMGQIMKASGGKADPKTTNILLRELIQTV